jgi:DNA polymerase III alpha subunit
MKRLVNATTAQLRDGSAEGTITVGGIVTRLRPTKIKSGVNAGKMMTRFVLEDLTGGIPITLFADQTARFGGLLRDEAVILVRGAVRNRGSEIELAAEDIVPLEQAKGRLVAGLEIAIAQELSTREMLRLRDLLAENPGDVPVSFDLSVSGSNVSITVPERFRVRLGPELESSIEGLLGHGSVRRRYASA